MLLSKELQSHHEETKNIEESIKETLKQSNTTEHKLKIEIERLNILIENNENCNR